MHLPHMLCLVRYIPWPRMGRPRAHPDKAYVCAPWAVAWADRGSGAAHALCKKSSTVLRMQIQRRGMHIRIRGHTHAQTAERRSHELWRPSVTTVVSDARPPARSSYIDQAAFAQQTHCPLSRPRAHPTAHDDPRCTRPGSLPTSPRRVRHRPTAGRSEESNEQTCLVHPPLS
jgi:hypothetical protein